MFYENYHTKNESLFYLAIRAQRRRGEAGELVIPKLILDAGYVPLAKDVTSLVRWNDLEAVKLSASLNEYSVVPSGIAAALDPTVSPDVLRALLQVRKIADTRPPYQYVPHLVNAIQSGDAEKVRVLLEGGANPNCLSSYLYAQGTALEEALAAGQGKRIDLVYLLLKHNVIVEHSIRPGKATPVQLLWIRAYQEYMEKFLAFRAAAPELCLDILVEIFSKLVITEQ